MTGMGSAHGHGDVQTSGVVPKRVKRVIGISVGLCAILTLLGLVLLWPSGPITSTMDAATLFGQREPAVITDNSIGPCSYDPIAGCFQVQFRITGGETANTTGSWERPYDPSTRRFHVDDEIYVYAIRLADGSTSYEFAEYERSTPLLLLVLIFVVAVLLLARWKGLGAIGGLIASLLVLAVFALPALLRGQNAVAVALVSASVIAFIALYLAHGINAATTVALLATFLSLALIGILAWIFVGASDLSGYTEDSTFVLTSLGLQIDARGLLLAGVVIGSLGVLDDVTVTQVSAVWEIRQARPSADRQDIYRSAVNIGRDHISSTVNTLFLTYAGAALPLLLLFSVAGQPISNVLTGEVIATELVRSLIGSVGLIASVPISTWLATLVITAAPIPPAPIATSTEMP